MGVISQDVRSGAKPDRNLALELVRVTEAAALAAARWVGRGEKEAADGAAVDAMRLLLDTVPMDGIVVIGEGEKDEAPMLYNGERIGDGSPPEVDIAVDPLEGTTLTRARNALGAGGDRAFRARHDVRPGPCVYMEKIAGSSEIADVLSLDDPLTEVIGRVAERKGKEVERRHRDHARPPAPRGEGRRDPRGSARESASSPTATSPRPCSRSRPTPASTCSGASAAPPRASSRRPRSSASAASSSASSGRATTPSGRPRSMPATTSTRRSTSIASSPARTSSSPAPGSPTASCCRASATRGRPQRPSRW